MEEHPTLRAELAVWEKTRLQPDINVTFGDKSTLYRYAEKQRVVRMDRRYWWAAAAMLAGSLFLLRNAFQTEQAAPDAPIAIVQPAPAPQSPAAPAATPAAGNVAPQEKALRWQPLPFNRRTRPVPQRSPGHKRRRLPATPKPNMLTPQPPPEAGTFGFKFDRKVCASAGSTLRERRHLRQRYRYPRTSSRSKTSIDVQHTASLATAAPEPPGELIMSVTGNGIESKVLDKVTNVARIFAKNGTITDNHFTGKTGQIYEV